MQYQKHSLRFWGALCWIGISFAVILASLASLQARNNNSPVRSSYSATELVALLGRSPITVDFDRMAIDLRFSEEEFLRYVSCLSAPGSMEGDAPSRSRKLHSGRLVAISGEAPDMFENREFQSKSVHTYSGHINLGTDEFESTWRGLEAAMMPNGERSEHRDQTLSTLAELGVNLNATIETSGGDVAVAELLIASINEFHLDQEEISWTASAFTAYLPPQTVWWNRYGEEFSFDTLAQEMMARKLNRESCRGLHLVMSLTQILKTDRITPILTTDIRMAVEAYVRVKMAEAIGSQLEDGSWPLQWSSSGYSDTLEFTPEDSILNRVLVTGHMLEWFQLSPVDVKPPIEVVQTGSLWMLDNLRTASREIVKKIFVHTPMLYCQSISLARVLNHRQFSMSRKTERHTLLRRKLR